MTEAAARADFEQVDRALKILDCDIGASECHGVLCGMLCSAQNFQVSNWLQHTLGYQDELELHELASNPAIQALFQHTLAAIDASDFTFSLLLPDDECTIGLRIEALGAWCRGFLSGFGVSDLNQARQLGEDTQDYLRDLHEIGKVDPEVLQAEGDEEALFEVQEYARVGALLLREDFKANLERAKPNTGGASRPSIH